MDNQRLLESFTNLVKIDSPSRGEGKIAAYLGNELESMGFSVSFDGSSSVTGSDTGNLIARLSGTAPGIVALTAHMDSVEPCCGIEPVVEDGVIRSAGETILAADDKAGIAAILEAVQSVREEGVPYPDILVIFTTCEELSLLGAKALPEGTFAEGTPCFVLDAGGAPGTIVMKAPSHYIFRAAFTGRAAHAGVEPEAGLSAIQMAAWAISHMELGRLDEATTANVGMIEGGTAFNVVPDQCLVSGECRSFYADRLLACKARITEALEAGASQFAGSVETSWELDYPEVTYDEDDPLVARLSEVARSIGLAANLTVSGGGADTNVFAKQGAKAITLGIGMSAFHSKSEYIALKDLEDSARLVEATIASFVKG